MRRPLAGEPPAPARPHADSCNALATAPTCAIRSHDSCSAPHARCTAGRYARCRRVLGRPASSIARVSVKHHQEQKTLMTFDMVAYSFNYNTTPDICPSYSSRLASPFLQTIRLPARPILGRQSRLAKSCFLSSGTGLGPFNVVLYVALAGVTCIWIVPLPSLYSLVGVPTVR